MGAERGRWDDHFGLFADELLIATPFALDRTRTGLHETSKDTLL